MRFFQAFRDTVNLMDSGLGWTTLTSWTVEMFTIIICSRSLEGP